MSDRLLDQCFSIFDKTTNLIDQTNRIMYGAAEIITKQFNRWIPKSEKETKLETVTSTTGTFLRNIQIYYRFGIGIALTGLLTWLINRYLIPTLPTHLPRDKNDQVVLVLGDMQDPITRMQVNDLYRRRFTVFVCAPRLTDGDSKDDQNEFDQDDGLFYISHTPRRLAQFVKFLSIKNRSLRAILVIPNTSYYPSGIFSNISSSQLQSEIQGNFISFWKILTKLLPHFIEINQLQVIIFNPSLSKNLRLPHHSIELVISTLADALYELLRVDYGSNLDIYQCHLGILNIAGNASNYKYLSIKGIRASRSLCKPVYQLIISSEHKWLRIMRYISGPVLCCGKGSTLSYYLGAWTPIWLLKIY